MPEGRNLRRRREDTWDDEPPSVPDQGPPASAADGTALMTPLREAAMPTSSTTRRRRVDTGDTEAAAGSDSGPSVDGQDGPGQQTPVDPAERSRSSGTLSWDEILSFGDVRPERVRLPRPQTASLQAASFDPEHILSQQARPTLPQRDLSPQPRQPAPFEPPTIAPSVFQQDPPARSWPDTSSQPQQPAPLGSEATLSSASPQAPAALRRPGAFSQPQQPAPFGSEPTLSSASPQAPAGLRRPGAFSQPQQPAPFGSEPTLSSASPQAPAGLRRPGAFSQPQRPRSGVDRGRWFRAYKALPIPRRLDEVRIPGRAELAAMEQVHGRPGPMSDPILHQFCRGYRVPPDIALGMRARSMIGLYPSSLIYLDYERLTGTPPLRHKPSGAKIPALYWVRILALKQAAYREHIEHFLSKSPGPCYCHNCQHEREHEMMTTMRGRWC